MDTRNKMGKYELVNKNCVYNTENIHGDSVAKGFHWENCNMALAMSNKLVTLTEYRSLLLSK